MYVYSRFTNYIFAISDAPRNFDVEDVQVHVAHLLFLQHEFKWGLFLYSHTPTSPQV